MLACLPDGEIERFIDEDLPYGDLTTHLLGIGHQPGVITFLTREDTTLCCCEEAGRVLEKCGCGISALVPSGTRCVPGTVFLSAQGTAQALHAGWKVALNLLEYASGIATRTASIVRAAKEANPDVVVVTTRKSFPGTKKVAIKAIMAGGALPHRLGLSETVLVFRQHTAFLGGLDGFLKEIAGLRARAPENRIIVEAESAEEALHIAGAGVDVVQVDKLAPAGFGNWWQMSAQWTGRSRYPRQAASTRETWPSTPLAAWTSSSCPRSTSASLRTSASGSFRAGLEDSPNQLR